MNRKIQYLSGDIRSAGTDRQKTDKDTDRQTSRQPENWGKKTILRNRERYSEFISRSREEGEWIKKKGCSGKVGKEGNEPDSQTDRQRTPHWQTQRNSKRKDEKGREANRGNISIHGKNGRFLRQKTTLLPGKQPEWVLSHYLKLCSHSDNLYFVCMNNFILRTIIDCNAQTCDIFVIKLISWTSPFRHQDINYFKEGVEGKNTQKLNHLPPLRPRLWQLLQLYVFQSFRKWT